MLASFVLGARGLDASEFTFANTNPVVIPANGDPVAPYPATIQVPSLAGAMSHVSVTLSNLHHAYPSDLDVLLTSPSGQSVLIMSDAGRDFAISNVTLTFDDAAPGTLPLAAVLTSGTFSEVSGEAWDNLVALDVATGRPNPWNPGSGVGVESLAAADNRVFVGSVHDRGGVARSNLAALDARTGLPLTDWRPVVDGPVTAIALPTLGGDKLYVGGEFMAVDGMARMRLAAVDIATGQLDASWDPGANATPLAMHADTGQVMVGGPQSQPRRRAELDVYSIELSNAIEDFGYPPGTREPAVADGYWIMLSPLQPGPHTIHIQSAGAYTTPEDPFDSPFSADVLYHLTVE